MMTIADLADSLYRQSAEPKSHRLRQVWGGGHDSLKIDELQRQVIKLPNELVP